MLLELFFICHLTFTFGNPFHKYPYVFLLDVGNEELQTYSEQIRVSIPGGSLALRYPAIGGGDNIAHVRVSGIDFGTDLKANIVDGGPGYKYVVIVFMGNPGVAYDAVITVSTLSSENDTDNTETDLKEIEDGKSSYQVAEDNVVQEDTNDSEETGVQKTDSSDEPVPSASNFYDSAENDDINGKEDENDDDNDGKNDEGLRVHSVKNTYENYKQNIEVQDYLDRNDQQDQDYQDSGAPQAESYNVNEEYIPDENNEAIGVVDRNSYEKYYALRPNLYDDVKVHPQQVNNAGDEVDNDGEVYSPEDPVELDQMFNDEEVHNDGEKYTDSNNNYSDADESSVVAYK